MVAADVFRFSVHPEQVRQRRDVEITSGAVMLRSTSTHTSTHKHSRVYSSTTGISFSLLLSAV